MTGDELRAITAAGPAIVMASKEDMLALLDERDALRAEVASLRLTLGGRTHSAADVVEPIGCPCPSACVQVAEIARLRAEVATASLARDSSIQELGFWARRAGALEAQIATARREGAEAMREKAALEVEDQTMEGHTRRACVASWQEACAHAAAAIRDLPLPGDDA